MRRLFKHRPSAAIVISLIALFFAMGGTAIAATGGTFILGKANTATSVSSLRNTKGSALSLSSTSTAPSLKVSNSLRVPRLNASMLDGRTSSAFLPAHGTAANSSALGGIPASGYMQGGGETTGGRATLTGDSGAVLLSTPAVDLEADCGPSPEGADLYIDASLSTTVLWWTKDGVVSSAGGGYVTPAYSTAPYVVVVQVDNGTSISTFTASEWYDSGSDTCHFAGQVITTNG